MCGSQSNLPPARRQREYLKIDGTRRWLRLSDERNPGCESASLGSSVSTIRWFGLIPGAKAAWLQRGVTLQGVETAEGVQVSEVEVPVPADRRRVALPLSLDLLQRLHPRIYGVEGRASMRSENDELQLRCEPGERPAGLVLRNDGARLPDVIDLNVAMTYQADARFGIAYADAPRVPLESPLQIGRLDPTGQPQTSTYPLPVSAADGRSGRDVSFTIACPNEGGRLSISRIQLAGIGGNPLPSRSVWIWRPADWQNQPQALLAELTAMSTPVVYISVSIDDDQVAEPAALATFIAMARAAEIEVWAVEGDPHVVLPDGQAAFARRAAALSSFNASQAEGKRLAGVQYDIEPYLLPEFSLQTNDWLVAYVQTIALLNERLNERLDIPLEIAVPFWWSWLEVDQAPLLDALAPHVQGLNVMNYRTEPGQLQQFAEPFLSWGVMHDVPVRIALEAGPIRNEVRWRFRAQPEAPSENTLWHLQLGAEHVLLLLDKPAVISGGVGYQLIGRSGFAGNQITFQGERRRMDRVMAELELIWAEWPSFAGLALHEYRLRDMHQSGSGRDPHP